MTTTTATPTSTVRRSSRARRSRRLATVLAAAGAALAVWAVAAPLLGVDLVAMTGATAATIGPVRVALSALVVGAAAWGLLAVLERVTARAGRAWTAVALTVLVVSLPAPLASATSLAAGVALAAVHLAVGAVLIGLLPRTAGPASPDAASARAPGRDPGRPGCAPPRAAPTLAAEEVRMGRGRVDALVVLLLGVWLLATPVLASPAVAGRGDDLDSAGRRAVP